MIAKSSIAMTSQSCTATPHRVTGKPNQIRLAKSAKSMCNNSPSETIEILERSTRTGVEFNPLASASVGMACVLLVAAFALSAIQVHAWLETQLQLNATDFVRVFAGL
jgi:hypothetical protein